MGAFLSVLYGGFAYLVFLGTILYAIAFVGNLGPWKTIDGGGPASGALTATLINAGLLTLFAAQHSIMARPGFKQWWTRFVPQPVERSTFVLLASLVLILLFWQWRPIAAPVWEVTGGAATALTALSWLGWGLVFFSTFLINHFELFGLTQVYARLRGRPTAQPVFRTPSLYKVVRHPLYLGFLFAFWAAPTMTAGHLLFAAATTGYILLGIFFEERDLVAQFGEQYRSYRQRVSMLIPLPKRGGSARKAESARVA